MVVLWLYSYFPGLCAFVWFRHRQKCLLRFVMRRLHVSLTSRQSIKGSHKKTFYKMGRRTKKFEKPWSRCYASAHKCNIFCFRKFFIFQQWKISLHFVSAGSCAQESENHWKILYMSTFPYQEQTRGFFSLRKQNTFSRHLRSIFTHMLIKMSLPHFQAHRIRCMASCELKLAD